MKLPLTGTLVTLVQKREDVPIRARRVPETVSSPRSKAMADVLERVVICNIPNGTQVLYLSSKADDFNIALRARGRGPYSYTPPQLIFHYVLWGERPAWISNEEVELRPC